jgi:hypothetical protein
MNENNSISNTNVPVLDSQSHDSQSNSMAMYNHPYLENVTNPNPEDPTLPFPIITNKNTMNA